MIKKAAAFTLIELIIVVIIVAFLAIIAIPRYFANIAKAQKAQVSVNLDAIRQAQLAYYAAYGTWRSSFPISVVMEGETIMSVSDPSTDSWTYDTMPSTSAYCRPSAYARATKQPGSPCAYLICVSTGAPYEGALPACTP